MSCEGYGLLISKWVDGEAKAEEARRAEAHVAACAACRKLAEEFRRNSGLVEAALGPEPFGHRVADRVFGSISRREASLRWGGRLAIAAGIFAAFLLFRSDRAEEARRVSDQIQAALRVVEQMQAAIDRERAKPREVVHDTVWKSYPVYYGPDGHLVERADPIPAIAEGPDEITHPVAPPNPRRRTMAMDRVDAFPDYETGSVALSWRMDRAPGSMWFVYRRPEGAEEWGMPLNQAALALPKFEDESALGLTSYEYRVIGLSAGVACISDEIARVMTPPDLRIEFKGRGTLDNQTSCIFGVHVRHNGKWFEDPFRVSPGETIGGLRGGVDYSTGVIFRKSEHIMDARAQYTRLRAEIETPTGRITLWNGASALGSREKLEADDRAR